MAAELVVTPRQVLVNVAETITASWYSDDGVAVDPGDVSVSIVNAAGTSVVASTSAAGSGSDPRTYALAGQASVDLLTVTWVSATYGAYTSTLEVVGALLFTVREARRFGRRELDSSTIYTADDIDRERARLTDALQVWCGVSFVPRYSVSTISGDGCRTLYLPVARVRAIRSIEYRTYGATDWTAYTVDELADVLVEPFGRLTRESLGTFTSGTQNIRIGYEHGYDTPPQSIREAAMKLAVNNLVPTDISSRAVSYSTDAGTTQLYTPGISARGQAMTPFPDVDLVLRDYDERQVVIA